MSSGILFCDCGWFGEPCELSSDAWGIARDHCPICWANLDEMCTGIGKILRRVAAVSGSERLAFIAKILERPHDSAPRMVFADWLEEHGQGAAADRIRRIERSPQRQGACQ